MAIFAATDFSLVWNAIDLSNHLSEADLPFAVAELDSTAMGAGQTTFIPGLRSVSLTATFQQDFAAAGSVGIALNNGYFNATIATATLKPLSSAVGTANPRYYGACFISEYTPLGGKVGDLAEAKVKFTPYATWTFGTS